MPIHARARRSSRESAGSDGRGRARGARTGAPITSLRIASVVGGTESRVTRATTYEVAWTTFAPNRARYARLTARARASSAQGLASPHERADELSVDLAGDRGGVEPRAGEEPGRVFGPVPARPHEVDRPEPG